MLKEKLVAAINWIESRQQIWKDFRLTDKEGWLYFLLRYCLYLAVTRNHAASYAVSSPPSGTLYPNWKMYVPATLLLVFWYMATEIWLFWTVLNTPFEHSTGMTVIEFSWKAISQWAGKDAVGLKETLGAAATIVGLYFLNRRAKASDKQARLAEEGLDIDRFHKGTEMLADDHASVRQAGIVSLKQLALSRPREYGPLVLDVFTNFLKKPDSGPTSFAIHKLEDRPDVHSAFRTAMEIWQYKSIRKWYLRKKRYLDMGRIGLHGGHYQDFDFQSVSFVGAEFVSIGFADIKFHSTLFVNTKFEQCRFGNSSFVGIAIFTSEFMDCDIADVNWNGATVGRVAINHEWNSFAKTYLENDRKIWLERAEQTFGKVWFCSDMGIGMFGMSAAEKLGYEIVMETCGSLTRIKFVESARSNE